MSAWDEQENERKSSDEPLEHLESRADVIDEEPTTTAPVKSKKKGGVNPRLLAVIFMVVVAAGSGLFFFKVLKKRPTPVVQEGILQPLEAPKPKAPDAGMISTASTDAAGADVLSPSPRASGAATAVQAQEPSPPASAPLVPAMVAPVAATVATPAVAPASAVKDSKGLKEPPATSDTTDTLRKVAKLEQRVDALTEQVRILGERRQVAKAAASDAPNGAKPNAKASHSKQAGGAVATKPTKEGTTLSERAMEFVKSQPGATDHQKPVEQVVSSTSISANAEMRVRTIYPMSGENVQAWVDIGAGKLAVVSVGSTIAGAVVKSVNPATMEVVTDAGVIRSRR